MRWSATLATASDSACRTEIASIRGGSPTALERKIASSRFCVLEQGDVEDARAVAAGGDLVGAGRVRAQAALPVPPQLLGGEPAHALDEAALDLADVQRRIQRLAAVVKDVDALDPVLAGQRVDRDLAAGGAIGEVVERPAGAGGAVPVDLGRLVEAGRGERDPAHVGLPDQGAEAGSPGCRPAPGWAGTRPARCGTDQCSAAKSIRRCLIVARRRQRRLAVEVGAGGGGGGRGVGHLAGGGGGDPHLVEVDLELLGHHLGHLGVEALPHLGAAMVQVHAAVGVDVHQRAGLVVGGQR